MDRSRPILVVEDDEFMRQTCTGVLSRAGYHVEAAASGEEALALVDGEIDFRVALIDLRLPKMDGTEILKRVRASHPEMKVVMMTGYASVASAVESMKLGASDFLVKPFENEILLKVVAQQFHVSALEHQVAQLRSELRGRFSVNNIVGRSASMEPVFDRIVAASGNRANVLIVGESGCGKELVARAIHYGGQADSPFVAVNCAALPESLIESELFGHVKGAFTGASGASQGLFRAAHGGTILLDEAFEMKPDMQGKLLRVLQERVVRPVGATADTSINVRVIATTNKDPMKLMATGGLRQDLYYRLNVVTIQVPPLRRRSEDIPLLVDHFREKFSRIYGFQLETLEPVVALALESYAWPGNVRELENVVEQWFAMGRREVRPKDLPPGIFAHARSAPSADVGIQSGSSVISLHDAERNMVRHALDATDQNKSKAAGLLGISRKKLYRILDESEATEES